MYRHRRLLWIPIEYWPKVLRYHGDKVIMVLRSVMPMVLSFDFGSGQLHASGANATTLGIRWVSGRKSSHPVDPLFGSTIISSLSY
jgi:hypothetical protein